MKGGRELYKTWADLLEKLIFIFRTWAVLRKWIFFLQNIFSYIYSMHIFIILFTVRVFFKMSKNRILVR